MTDKLSRQALKDLVNYRLGRANETLEAANYLASGEYYTLAMERLYYACFYVASALMLINNIAAGTHSGIKTMLNLNFIKTGKLASKYGIIYQTLFEKRQSGDYEDFIYCNKEMYDDLYPQAVEFIERIKCLVYDHPL